MIRPCTSKAYRTPALAIALLLLLALVSCAWDGSGSADGSGSSSSEAVTPTPLVLAADEGERRTWRVGGGIPFLIKVDRRHGGSEQLVMGYEEIPPGVTIPTHRHLVADEIIFVQRGSGVARVGDLEEPFDIVFRSDRSDATGTTDADI